MLPLKTISIILLILVTFSATHAVKRSYIDSSIRPNNHYGSIDNELIDEFEFGYDSNYDFEQDFMNHFQTDSESDSDVDNNTDSSRESDDDENVGPMATSQQKPNAPYRFLNRRNAKHNKKKDEMIQNHACGVHIVQKYFSRNIFSYRIFGPYAWGYQQVARGPRAERRPFPVSIPLPMLPAKLNMTVTVDRDESMYPFANVYFEYGADSWKSSDSRCKVGGYDRNLADLNWNERRIDCSFACF